MKVWRLRRIVSVAMVAAVMDQSGASHVLLKPAEAASKKSQISLEEAVRKAVSWHPSIDEAMNRIGEKGEEIDVARSGYLPRIRGGVKSNYESADKDGWKPRLSLSASQMVYDFGKVSSAVEAATAGAAVSRAQLLVAVDQLIRDTSYAFIELQRYRALLGVAQDQVNGVTAISKLVRQRSDEGASTRSDQIQAEARVQAAESTMLEISAQLNKWQSSLAYLIGAEKAFGVPKDVPKWLAKSCDQKIPDWSKVPALLEAEAERKEALAELDGSRAQGLPTLSLEAETGYDLNNSSSDSPNFNVGFNFTGDIYQGGANKARKNAANYALRAADAARDKARFEVQRNLAEARDQTGSLGKLLSSLSSRDGMMMETRDLYRQQYVELGTRTLLDLLNAEQELHQARFDTANTVHDLRRLRVDCLFNAGLSRAAFGLEGTVIRGVTLQP